MGNDLIYDQTKNTLYIKLIKESQSFIINILSELSDLNPQKIILDIRGFNTRKEGLISLAEKLKANELVITLIDNQTSLEIINLFSSWSSIINYDDLKFQNEEEKALFEEYPIDGVETLKSDFIERLNIYSEEQYLNAISKEYLKDILNEYSSYLTDEKKDKIESLLQDDFAIVHQNHEEYIAKKMQANEPEEEKDYPIAHGGKVFGDGKIHFYLDKNATLKDMEGVLIHELFHYLIEPSYSENYPNIERINSHITEGLVDMCTLDYLNEKGILPDYQSNYNREVLLVRDMLKTVGDPELIKTLITSGSIDQIIKETTNSPEEFITIYQNTMSGLCDYEKLITQIASLDKEHQDGYLRSLMRLGARTNPIQAVEIIKQTFDELTPEMLNKTSEEVNVIKNTINSYIESFNKEGIVK